MRTGGAWRFSIVSSFAAARMNRDQCRRAVGDVVARRLCAHEGGKHGPQLLADRSVKPRVGLGMNGASERRHVGPSWSPSCAWSRWLVRVAFQFRASRFADEAKDAEKVALRSAALAFVGCRFNERCVMDMQRQTGQGSTVTARRVQPRARHRQTSSARKDHRARSHGVAEGARYIWRALVEADISRYKRTIGDALRSCTDGRRANEVAIAVRAPNRMLDLGRSKSVRIA